MSAKKIAFFDAKPYDIKSFDAVNQHFDFDITYLDTHLNEKTANLCEGHDAVCAFVNATINAEVINTLVKHNVSIIAMRCAGYNNVDLNAAANNLHVVRVPAYSPYAVAEHAVALMMSLNRKIYRAYHRTRDYNFSINGLLGFDMYRKTAGVIGTGKIGQCLIGILKGFGMKVLAYDPFPNEEYAEHMGITYTDLETIYRESDIVSFHCPLTPETEHMINKSAIKQMKQGVMLINTSRGKLVNTKALINGLKAGHIGAAGLDVYEEESGYFFEDKSMEGIPDDVLARLMTFPNVLITSHQGFFTTEALQNIAETTLNNLKVFFDEGCVKNAVTL